MFMTTKDDGNDAIILSGDGSVSHDPFHKPAHRNAAFRLRTPAPLSRPLQRKRCAPLGHGPDARFSYRQGYPQPRKPLLINSNSGFGLLWNAAFEFQILVASIQACTFAELQNPDRLLEDQNLWPAIACRVCQMRRPVGELLPPVGHQI